MKRTFAKLLSLFVVLTLVIAMVPAVFAVDGIVSVTAENTTLKVNKSTTVSVKDANGADCVERDAHQQPCGYRQHQWHDDHGAEGRLRHHYGDGDRGRRNADARQRHDHRAVGRERDHGRHFR